MKKAFKYRLYPNKTQEQKLAQSFGCSRFVWNQAVVAFNIKTKQKSIPELKIEHSFLSEVSCSMLQQRQRDFEQTKAQFFSKSRKSKINRPAFRKKGTRDSFRLPCPKFKIFSTKIQLERIGKVPAKIHREIPPGSKLINVTVSRNPSGQYFASVLVEVEINSLPSTGKTVGVDLGLTSFLVDSDGGEVEAPKYCKKSYKPLPNRHK